MRLTLASAAALAALALPVQTAHAQGYGVFEHGSCAMARAGTGVADPCDDGSAIFFNPAGLTNIEGLVLSVGATGIDAFGGFTDDLTGTKVDLANSLIPVPHLYLAYGAESFSAGIGVFVPYGLGTKWPDTFEGRFNGYDNDLQAVYIQPTFAIKLGDMVSIGAGFDYVLSTVELNQRIDLSDNAVPLPTVPPGTTFGNLGVPFHTDFGNARIRAEHQTGFGANFGITITPSDRISFGARYLMQVDVDYEGTVEFEPVNTGIILPAGNPYGVPAGTPLDAVVASAFAAGGPLVNQNGATSLPMPNQIVAGMAFNATDALTLLVDYQLTRWSVFEQIVLDFSEAATPDRTIPENYTDAHGIRGGFELETSDMFRIRAGYLYHTAAAPDETVTPLLPEGRRNEITVGFGFDIAAGVTADLAYQYIRQDNRRGRVREPIAGAAPTVALNTGVYEFRAHLFGLTFSLAL